MIERSTSIWIKAKGRSWSILVWLLVCLLPRPVTTGDCERIRVKKSLKQVLQYWISFQLIAFIGPPGMLEQGKTCEKIRLSMYRKKMVNVKIYVEFDMDACVFRNPELSAYILNLCSLLLVWGPKESAKAIGPICPNLHKFCKLSNNKTYYTRSVILKYFKSKWRFLSKKCFWNNFSGIDLSKLG